MKQKLRTIKEEQTASRTKAQLRLSGALSSRQCTLLAVGPMSKSCVDAVIELAQEVRGPLMLIASRRQVDMADLGGGYANNWTTETFAQYVRSRDPAGRVILARDHGGPWQNQQEVIKNFSLVEAMESAKKSYATDIKAGFEVLHLDPSIDIHHQEVPQEELLERLFELYEFCYETAQRYGREIIVEVGTEEQTGEQENIAQLQSFLERIIVFCEKRHYPKPFFVVVQTGTKVKETRNVGNLGAPFRRKGIIPPEVHIAKLVETCEQYGVHMKEHNTDYLSDDTLEWHPRVGIHSANVAPEFGVAETRQILRICDEFGLAREREAFMTLAYESGKWEKWLVEDSQATIEDKAIIAGHYVLSTSPFLEIKERIAGTCEQHGFDLDESIRGCLKHVIRRYLYHFNLL